MPLPRFLTLLQEARVQRTELERKSRKGIVRTLGFSAAQAMSGLAALLVHLQSSNEAYAFAAFIILSLFLSPLLFLLADSFTNRVLFPKSVEEIRSREIARDVYLQKIEDIDALNISEQRKEQLKVMAYVEYYGLTANTLIGLPNRED